MCPITSDENAAPNIPYVTYHVLARLDIPAGTSTILDSMITDTREYCELFRRGRGEVPGTYAEKTDTASTTTIQDLADLDDISFTAEEDRVYEIIGHAHIGGNSSGDVPVLWVRDSGNTKLDRIGTYRRQANSHSLLVHGANLLARSDHTQAVRREHHRRHRHSRLR